MPSKTPNVRLDYARSNQGEIFSQLSDAVLEGNDAIQPESQMKWIKYVTEPLYCEWIKHVTESLDEMMWIKHATEPLGEIKWIKYVTGLSCIVISLALGKRDMMRCMEYR